MNSWVCVDANLIIWSLIPSPLSSAAEELLSSWQQTDTSLIAPALLAFEVTATLRRMVYLKQITPIEGEEAFARFQRVKIHLSYRQSIFPLAWELAKEFNMSRACDTSYLALAQLNQCEFWTADEKLYNTVQAKLPWVNWLGNYPQ